VDCCGNQARAAEKNLLIAPSAAVATSGPPGAAPGRRPGWFAGLRGHPSEGSGTAYTHNPPDKRVHVALRSHRVGHQRGASGFFFPIDVGRIVTVTVSGLSQQGGGNLLR